MIKHVSNNFEFSLGINDTIFVLVRSSCYKDSNEVSKMVITKKLKNINLNYLSKTLGYMLVEKLNIFSINKDSELDTINFVSNNKGFEINFIEMRSKNFIKFLNFENSNLFNYNNHCLYIIRSGNLIEINNLFKIIIDCHNQGERIKNS